MCRTPDWVQGCHAVQWALRWHYCHGCAINITSIADVAGDLWQGPVDGMGATPTSCRDIMVVLSLIGRDHCPYIMRCPLHVLSHRAPRMCAFIVAPAIRQREIE